MRRALSPWLLLGLFMSAASPLQAQTFVTTRPVRLRQGPSASEPVLRMLKLGERVTLLIESGSGSFYKVKTEHSEEGWVHGRYLIPPWIPDAETLAFTEFASAAYPPCGGAHHFRWLEKTDLGQSSLTSRAVSIPALLHWAPLRLGQDLASWCAPRQGRELRAFAVSGWVRRVRKQEADGDWHVEVTSTAQSDPNSCIVVEIPDPSYDSRFSAARDALDARLQGSVMSTAGDVSPPVRVTFFGTGFYDGWHSSSTGAKGHGRCNSSLGALWEIHPVFSVTSP